MRKFLLTGILAGLTLLSACKKEQMATEMRPAQGGKFYGGTYRVNELAELRSLDPIQVNDVVSSKISDQIYDRLLMLDENLKLQPQLAERWEVSPDGMTYTYYLRRGVKFHDSPAFPEGKGRELTAEDVRYSYTRLCDPRAGTLNFGYVAEKVKGAQEFFKSVQEAQKSGGEPTIKEVTGFKVIDPYTFAIELVKPFAPFEFYPSLTSFGIHPREAVEHFKGDFRFHPVGTGPFVFESWAPDRNLVLKRNPTYWAKDNAGNQLPFLDEIQFTFMKDEKTQLLEFKQGNHEESYRIPNEFFADIVDENKNAKGEYTKFKVLHEQTLATQFYGMLTTDPVFKDKRIRQAISYAVDRDRIIRYVLKGQAGGPGNHGLVPPSVPDYNAQSITGYAFNAQKAKELMAQAGYPDGKGFPAITLQLNAGGGRNTAVAEAIQSMLSQNLGITVNLNQVEFARHTQTIDEGKAPFYRLGWVGDYPDPETFLNLLYGKLVPADPANISPINSTRFQNAEFDRLFEQALSTTDRLKRFELYRQAEQIAINEAPMLIVFYDEDYRLLQPYVEDYRGNPMDTRFYRYVWLNPAKRK
ncbi:MAG TPA: ABC transporter substrate-binding protein [Patescibacteria group bacterium]|nr:ABC transporter substrate-binding protein [Patescibacteria group bacterium]